MNSLLYRFLPFLNWLPRVTPGTLHADLLAGLTGAVIVLPQGIAYATIAGLPPVYGLYTAIIPPVIAGLFGSSRHLVSGPAAAISIVVFSIVSSIVPPDSPRFLPYVLTLTFLAGGIQLLLGIFRVGTLVNFISHTVVVGFTSGAAVLIAASQLTHFFDLVLPAGGSLVETLGAFATAVPRSNPYAVLIGTVTLVSAVAVRRFLPGWPHLLLAMAAGSACGLLANGRDHGVDYAGAMPGQLPPMSLDLITPSAMPELASGALALAVIALIEAVSIARSVAIKSHQRIDGNQEFIGQGLANVVGSLFSCFAGSGSFTRTGANYEAGARTPLAAVFAAGLLLAIILLAPGLTAFLPMPAMAGVVLAIAWNLVEFRQIRRILRVSREETAILAVTFLATLLLDLEFAIYAGVILSLFLFLKRSARPYVVPVAPVLDRPGQPLRNAAKRRLPECPQLKILRIDGPMFFGSVDHIQGHLNRQTERGYRHVLIEGSGVDFIDVAGAEMLAQEAKRFRDLDGCLWLSSFKDPAGAMLRHPVYLDAVGADRIFHSPSEALATAFGRIELCGECRREGTGRCRILQSRASGRA